MNRATDVEIHSAEAAEWAALYWLLMSATTAVIGVFEQWLGDGSFARLVNSPSKFTAVVVIFAFMSGLCYLFGRLARTMRCQAGPLRPNRRKRLTWPAVSIMLGVILGGGIALLA